MIFTTSIVGGRTLRWATVSALAVLAAACASVDGAEPTVSMAGAPAPTPMYDWHYMAEDGEVRLVFGLQDSDDVQMGLSCLPGSGALDMFALVDKATEIHLESGGDTERFSAQAEPSELHDGHVLTAQATTQVPVFKRFRRLGWMASLHDGRRDLYVAHPPAAANIETFFSLCG